MEEGEVSEEANLVSECAQEWVEGAGRRVRSKDASSWGLGAATCIRSADHNPHCQPKREREASPKKYDRVDGLRRLKKLSLKRVSATL